MRELITSAVDKAAANDAAGFIDVTKQLEADDWADSQEDILHALAIVLERQLPDLGPTQAADLATNVRTRFEGSFAIQQIVLESVVRGVLGETKLLEGIPHNVLLLYALLLTSELVKDSDTPSWAEIFDQIDDERATREQ